MRRVAALVDGGAESPQESRLRVRLVLAGSPGPGHPVRGGARWPFHRPGGPGLAAVKIAVEYDGLWHHDPEQFHRDRQRLNRLLGEDWIVLHLTAKRFKEDFPAFLSEVRQALHSRTH